MKMSNIKTQKGFGIVEVLLAGLILIIIVGAMVFIANSSINKTAQLQQRIQATFLAQEGLESVHRLRDSNYIDANPATKWNYLANSGSFGIPVNDQVYYFYSGSGGLYASTDSSQKDSKINETTFTRSVKFTRSLNSLLSQPQIGQPAVNISDVAIRVTVTVTWSSFGQTKNVSLEEILTDSRQQF